MPQNPLQTNVAVEDGARVPLNTLDGKLLVANGDSSSLNITTGTVVITGAGRIVRFVVTTAGAAGTIHDFATVGGGTAATLIATIPATVGIYYLDFPVTTGILVTPGADQVVSVSYS